MVMTAERIQQLRLRLVFSPQLSVAVVFSSGLKPSPWMVLITSSMSGVDFDLPLLLLRLIWRVHDFLSVASRTRGKTKTARPSGRWFAASPSEIFVQRIIPPHIGGNSRSRSRHRGSPLLGCQTHFGVIPDVSQNVSRSRRSRNQIWSSSERG